MDEMLVIFDITQGGVQYKDLLEMPFDYFDSLLNKCIEVNKRIRDSFKRGED